jgi:transcriptional regulator with XRE-family HTH domain
METLGERIKARRLEVDLSVEDVATACAVRGSAVYQWESDDTKPTGPNIVRLAAALRTYEAWLTTGEGPRVRAIPTDTLTPEESEMLEAFRTLDPETEQEAMRTTIINIAIARRKRRDQM